MTEAINASEWQDKVNKSLKPVFVDFYADWCGPCKMMAPVIDEIAQDYKGSLEVYKINIDENPDIARQYGVMSIPTFILFKNGEVVAQQLGAVPKERLVAMLS